jgi:hypothetical protein
MKSMITSAVLCLILTLAVSCKRQPAEEPEPVDPRDRHVGLYVCEVENLNMITKEMFATYTDTLELVKQGPDKIIVKNKLLELPELENYPPHMYAGPLTILTINQDQITLVHGLDWDFYEFKGHRLE